MKTLRIRLLALCLGVCSLALPAHAQSAREVLDAAAARMTQAGGVRAQFRITQYAGATPQQETTGTMLLSGRRFQLTTPEMTVWFDGQTQWAMLRGADEVNVSQPDEEEQAAMNPAVLVGIYRKGYTYKMRPSTLRGKATYEIRLRPKSKDAAFQDIYVDVEQGTSTPMCFRAKRDGNWVRLSVTSFQAGQNLPASTFTFPSHDYPHTEVIDLR